MSVRKISEDKSLWSSFFLTEFFVLGLVFATGVYDSVISLTESDQSIQKFSNRSKILFIEFCGPLDPGLYFFGLKILRWTFIVCFSFYDTYSSGPKNLQTQSFTLDF